MDPLIPLAFAIQQGTHALLLGSGVSRSAGIPTGWEVLLDLIRKMAAIEGVEAADPESWYRDRFGQEPSYAALLEMLAPKPAERALLLRAYFEPDAEDRQEGRKRPTQGHHAVARLVAAGHVRVIITPNFDRLIERALEEAGVEPTVVSNGPGAAGAPPISQANALVIKANGDYLDLRTRNTTAELARYDRSMTRLLRQAVDQFGLVACGWSADWDEGLREIILAAPNRRFTMYWAHRGDLSEAARAMVSARDATTIVIAGADSFLTDLADKVDAVRDLGKPHPVSSAVAVATVKAHVLEPTRRIRLRDFLMNEVERQVPLLGDQDFPVASPSAIDPELKERAARYDARMEILAACLATGCYWGGDDHRTLWAEVIERVGNSRQEGSGLSLWLDMLRYPAMVLLYAAGIAAVAAARYETLAALLTLPRLRHPARDDLDAAAALTSYAIIPYEFQKHLVAGKKFPLSEHLWATLRPALRDAVPDDDRYTDAFDRYEYFAALRATEHSSYRAGSPGRFLYRRVNNRGETLPAVIRAEAQAAGADWPPLILFDGSAERYEAAQKEFAAWVARVHWDL